MENNTDRRTAQRRTCWSCRRPFYPKNPSQRRCWTCEGYADAEHRNQASMEFFRLLAAGDEE